MSEFDSASADIGVIWGRNRDLGIGLDQGSGLGDFFSFDVHVACDDEGPSAGAGRDETAFMQ